MPKLVSLTSALQAKGRYHDSLNLYLDVQRPGVSASWAFLYERGGRQITLGLGSAIGGRGPKVSRALARRKAAACIAMLAEGKDPKQERLRQRAEGTTLGTLLERMLLRNAPKWSNPRMAGDWRGSLAQHAGRLLLQPASTITGDDVHAALKPIWNTIPARAEHVRQRLESLLDYAVAEGCRASGPNPARWAGYLEHRLGVRAAGGHHAAMEHADVPAFMQRLAAAEGAGMRALELLVFTGLRSEEVRQARWDEIDLDAGRWTIPASRMKTSRVHVVVLSNPALALLRTLPRVPGNPHVFAWAKAGKPINKHALDTALRKLGVGRDEASVHGFRNTFMEWVKASRPDLLAVADWCLAHVPHGKTAQAYSRQQPVEQCGNLLAIWADYCTAGTAEVVRLRA